MSDCPICGFARDQFVPLAEVTRLREFVEHVAGQPTILIGNPYHSLAHRALTPEPTEEGSGG